MVLDTSAILAILLGDADGPIFAEAIGSASARLLSAASLVEASIVLETRKGDAGGRELDLLIYRSEIEIVPVGKEQAELARAAWRKFGKGRHPAALNYGDCFPYALAKITESPLLYKGDDFALTDVVSALS